MKFPDGVTGVYIKSKRMTKQERRPVYYFVGHSSAVVEKSLDTTVYGRSLTSGLIANGVRVGDEGGDEGDAEV